MQGFRNLLRGWFGKFLLALFILPFAFFGIDGIFNSAGRSNVSIKVNGDEISKQEILKNIELQKQSIQQRLGNIDPSVITDEMVRPNVEKTLIQKKLLNQSIQQQGFAIPRAAVNKYVTSIDQLKDAEGKFSEDRFKMMLQRLGYSGVGFYDEVTQQMLVDQLKTGIEKSAFSLPKELKTLVKLDRQTRDIATLKVTVADFKAGVEVSEAEIAAYFDKNKARYKTDEQVKVKYIVVSAENLGIDEPDEQVIQTRFQERVEAENAKERRRAQHILVEVNDDRSDAEALERIQEAKAKLDNGESFESVAKQFSDDFATAKLGGDLGYSGKGLYDPEFDKTLFSLQEGETSGEVKTEFGYHLIKLTGIEKAEIPELTDEVRQEIVSEIKADLAQEQLTEALDELNRLGFESGDLAPAAEKYNVDVQSSGWISRFNGEGVLSNSKVIAAAFSESVMIDKENSEAIEVGGDKLVMLRLQDHKPAATKSLDEVKDLVKSTLVAQKALEIARVRVDEILAKLDAGSGTSDIESEYGLKWSVTEKSGRQNAELDQQVVKSAFELPKPEEGKHSVTKVQSGTGDQIIVLVSKVYDGEYTLSDAEAEQLKTVLSDRFGYMDYVNYIETLETDAKIERL